MCATRFVILLWRNNHRTRSQEDTSRKHARRSPAGPARRLHACRDYGWMATSRLQTSFHFIIQKKYCQGADFWLNNANITAPNPQSVLAARPVPVRQHSERSRIPPHLISQRQPDKSRATADNNSCTMCLFLSHPATPRYR